MVSTLGIRPICSPQTSSISTGCHDERMLLSIRAYTSTEVTQTNRNIWLYNKGRFGAPQHRRWDVQRFLPQTRETLYGENFQSIRSELGSLLFEWGWKSATRISQRDWISISRGRNVARAAGNEDEYCDRLPDQPSGACSFPRSESPNPRQYSETTDTEHTDYIIRVSKELMGVFRYVEKVKRARIKELADTLRQTAGACMFFSCVRGIVGPLVEVFKTEPPSWGKLILMFAAFDSFAITYLALKASEPLEKLSKLATEKEKDIMGSIGKEEEHMLALAVELVKLFKRLRNITVCTAVAQFASLAHSLLQLNNPKFVESATKAFGAWLNTPRI